VSSIYELPIEAYARTTCSFGVANKLHIAFGITFRFFRMSQSEIKLTVEALLSWLNKYMLFRSILRIHLLYVDPQRKEHIRLQLA